MTANDYLKQIEKLDKTIQSILSEIKEQRKIKSEIPPNLNFSDVLTERLKLLKEQMNDCICKKNVILDEIRSLQQ